MNLHADLRRHRAWKEGGGEGLRSVGFAGLHLRNTGIDALM